MPEPYLTADRLEDFRTEAEFEAIYEDEAQARLERIARLIDDAVNAASPSIVKLDKEGAIDMPGKSCRAQINRPTAAERIAWAKRAIREALTDTILPAEEARNLAERA